MSGKITGIVWESDLPQNEKYVLLAYADHADHEGNGIFPSVGLIAWKTGYTDRNVKRIKKSLLEKGYLVETGMRPSGTPVYRMEINNLPMLKPRGDNLSPGDTHVTPGVTPTSPEPSYNRQSSLSNKADTPKNQKSQKQPQPKKRKLPPSPPPLKDFGPLALAILEVTKTPYEMLTNGTWFNFYNTLGALVALEANEQQIREFGAWFGLTPSFNQITDNWGLFMAGELPRHKQYKQRGQKQNGTSTKSKQHRNNQTTPGTNKWGEAAKRKLAQNAVGPG